MQLPHPLLLHGEISADFRDLAFDCVQQIGGSAPRASPRSAAYDFGFRHSIPILTGRDADVCPLWNGTKLMFFGVCTAAEPLGRCADALGFDVSVGGGGRQRESYPR